MNLAKPLSFRLKTRGMYDILNCICFLNLGLECFPDSGISEPRYFSALSEDLSWHSAEMSKASKQLAQFIPLIPKLQRDCFFQLLPQIIQGIQEAVGLQASRSKHGCATSPTEKLVWFVVHPRSYVIYWENLSSQFLASQPGEFCSNISFK